MLRDPSNSELRIKTDEADAQPKQQQSAQAKTEIIVHPPVTGQPVKPTAEAVDQLAYHGWLLMVVSRFASVSQCSIRKPCGLLSERLTFRR